MSKICIQCTGKSQLLEFLYAYYSTDELQSKITYKQWISTDRAHLKEINETNECFLQTLLTAISSTTEHHFISLVQARYYQNLKSSLKQNELLVQVDFAENFTLFSQNSIQV